MTGILSREQEFIKLNEQLDNLTMHAVEKPPPPKIEAKFCTYTKKGPGTILRQANAIDYALAGQKDKGTYHHFTSKDPPIAVGLRKKPLFKERPQQSQPPVVEKRNLVDRAPVRYVPVNRSVASKHPSNIVLRYKNNAFVQSPSLEVLVKEENESIRSQAPSVSSEVSNRSTTRRSANLSSDGLEKYLKSRIAIMQEEHETLTHEMLNQKDLVEKSLERQKKIENQRDLAYTRNNSLTEQLTKLESQLEDVLESAKENEIVRAETQKHLESARRENKVLHQTNANLEKRLLRTNEELENAKNSLNQFKKAEKESKESIRNETDSRDKQIRALKKQCAELLNANKKQIFLIDNLKRQNMCLVQSRLIGFGEKEFAKVLDWQAKN